MQKRLLSPEEKERLAFRIEQLTFLCTATTLLDDIQEMMHDSPEEQAGRSEKDRQDFGEYNDANRKVFTDYLRQARNLPDDEDLFFAGLAGLLERL